MPRHRGWIEVRWQEGVVMAKVELALGIFAAVAGLYLLASGILLSSGLHILWGVIIIGIGMWRIIASYQRKAKGERSKF